MAEHEPPGPGPDEGSEEGSEAERSLREAEEAFERGDYARVRRLTAPLLDAPDPEIARRALELRRRVQVDPAQLVVLALCFLFFGWVAWKYVLS